MILVFGINSPQIRSPWFTHNIVQSDPKKNKKKKTKIENRIIVWQILHVDTKSRSKTSVNIENLAFDFFVCDLIL